MSKKKNSNEQGKSNKQVEDSMKIMVYATIGSLAIVALALIFQLIMLNN